MHMLNTNGYALKYTKANGKKVRCKPKSLLALFNVVKYIYML